MTKIRIDKKLCAVGQEIDNNLDDLLAKQRYNPTNQLNDEIYKLIKLYFGHRKSCGQCHVQIRFAEE